MSENKGERVRCKKCEKLRDNGDKRDDVWFINQITPKCTGL